MFNARVFFTASVMTLFLYPMTAMAADVSPPTSGADAEGNLPNVTVTLCSGQSDGYSWTSKKDGNTYVCQKGVPVLKGSDVKPKPCTALDGSCGGFQTDKKGNGGSGNGKGSGGDGNGKGSGGGTGGSPGSGGGSGGTGSGSGGTGAASGSGGSGSAGAGSGNEVQGSGAASPDRGSGGGAGGGSGATSGNDAGGSGGSSGPGSGSGDSGTSNAEYLAAIREWGKKWAEFFKKLAESEKNIQQSLPNSLAYCLRVYGRNTIDAQKCSDDVIKSAEKSMKELEEIRQKSIERMAKEKAAIDAMKPHPVPNVPMPDGNNGLGGGNGGNTTNNNITNNIINNDTTINNNTNITNNGGGSGGGKSGGNGNGGSGQTGNNMGNGSGGEDGKGKGDGLSEYCAKNPDALACQKMGKMSDVKFPDSDAENHLDKGLKDFKSSLKEKGKVASEGFAYKYRNFLSRGDTAACPPPITFEAFGVKGAFKYDWLCQSMEMARGLVIAAFALFTAFFVVKNLK